VNLEYRGTGSLFPPDVSAAAFQFANAGVTERGANFTRPEVVDFILDLVRR
jgi:hypothetical protein